MINLKSNQRLYISKDLRGYVDKLRSDGVIPYAYDFLKIGFSYAVSAGLRPADNFERHELTTDTQILGSNRVIIEAVAQWYARKTVGELRDSAELLDFICSSSVSGGKALKKRWHSKTKSMIQKDIVNL